MALNSQFHVQSKMHLKTTRKMSKNKGYSQIYHIHLPKYKKHTIHYLYNNLLQSYVHEEPTIILWYSTVQCPDSKELQLEQIEWPSEMAMDKSEVMYKHMIYITMLGNNVQQYIEGL